MGWGCTGALRLLLLLLFGLFAASFATPTALVTVDTPPPAAAVAAVTAAIA